MVLQNADVGFDFAELFSTSARCRARHRKRLLSSQASLRIFRRSNWAETCHRFHRRKPIRGFGSAGEDDADLAADLAADPQLSPKTFSLGLSGPLVFPFFVPCLFGDIMLANAGIPWDNPDPVAIPSSPLSISRKCLKVSKRTNPVKVDHLSACKRLPFVVMLKSKTPPEHKFS